MEQGKAAILALLTVLILLTASEGGCGEPYSVNVAPGSYLRISAGTLPEPVEGTVTAVEKGRLVIDPGPGKAPLTIDLADVSGMDLRTRESTRGKGTGWGAAAGGFGFLALVAATDGCGGDGLYPDEFCYGSAFVLGGAVGALVGLIASHGERWEAVPLIKLPGGSGSSGRQGLEGRDNGFGVAVSLRY